jgi:hypothetical protein
MEAKGEFVQQEMGNQDRRMILVDQSTREEEEKEEEEYDFGQDAEGVQAPKIWFALARFYFGQDFSTWTVFRACLVVFSSEPRSHITARPCWTRLSACKRLLIG